MLTFCFCSCCVGKRNEPCGATRVQKLHKASPLLSVNLKSLPNDRFVPPKLPLLSVNLKSLPNDRLVPPKSPLLSVNLKSLPNDRLVQGSCSHDLWLVSLRLPLLSVNLKCLPNDRLVPLKLPLLSV